MALQSLNTLGECKMEIKDNLAKVEYKNLGQIFVEESEGKSLNSQLVNSTLKTPFPWRHTRQSLCIGLDCCHNQL